MKKKVKKSLPKKQPKKTATKRPKQKQPVKSKPRKATSNVRTPRRPSNSQGAKKRAGKPAVKSIPTTKTSRSQQRNSSSRKTPIKSTSKKLGRTKAKSIVRDAKVLAKEARQTKRIIQHNLKASKKAVKQLRDAIGRFTAAYKKFSNKKAKAIHAAKQLATSKQAAKGTKKDQGRKQATKPRPTKAPVSAPRSVRSHRGQGKGDKERARSKGTGEAARNKPTRLRGVKAGKQSYKLQELASSKSKNLGKLLAKIEERTDQIDALKRPDQMWAFQIYDRHSLVPYESIGGMMEFLQASGGLLNSAKEDTGLWTKVSILTKGEAGQPMANTVLDYRREVEARQLAQRTENAAIDKAARARFGSKGISGRRKSKYQLLADYEAQFSKLEKEKDK